MADLLLYDTPNLSYMRLATILTFQIPHSKPVLCGVSSKSPSIILLLAQQSWPAWNLAVVPGIWSILASHRWVVLMPRPMACAIPSSGLPCFLSTAVCLWTCQGAHTSSSSDSCTSGRYSSPLFTSTAFGMGVWGWRGNLYVSIDHVFFSILFGKYHASLRGEPAFIILNIQGTLFTSVKKWLPTTITACVFVTVLTILWQMHSHGLLDATDAMIAGSTSAAILTTITIFATKTILDPQRQLAEWKHRYATETRGLHYYLSNVYEAITNRGTYPITRVYVDGQELYKYTSVGFHSNSLTSTYGRETFSILDKETRTNLLNVIEAAKEHFRYLGEADELALGHNFEENKLPNEKIGKILDCYKMICHYEKIMKDLIPKIIEALKRPLPDSLWDSIYNTKSHDRFGHNYVSEDGSVRVETTMPTLPRPDP